MVVKRDSSTSVGMTNVHLFSRLCSIIIAHLSNWANRTLGFSCSAVVSPEEYERVMGSELLLVGELLLENPIGFFRSLGFDYPDTIHNSVHVGIYSDIWSIIEHREHDFCGLDPDPGKRLEQFQIIGDDATEFALEFCARITNESCLVPVKIHRRNHTFHLLKREV